MQSIVCPPTHICLWTRSRSHDIIVYDFFVGVGRRRLTASVCILCVWAGRVWVSVFLSGHFRDNMFYGKIPNIVSFVRTAVARCTAAATAPYIYIYIAMGTDPVSSHGPSDLLRPASHRSQS